MVYFRVNENINIKTTDGTLVNYLKFKLSLEMSNETIYISTFDDFNDLNDVFQRVDAKKYSTTMIREETIREIANFPIELGISNVGESYRIKEVLVKYTKENMLKDVSKVSEFLISEQKVDLYKQLKVQKDEIKIAIIGGVGRSISEMIASCTALRILYGKLKELHKKVELDIFISASNNSFYSRDKQIYLFQDFVNSVNPLGLSLKKLSEYDYFIDSGSIKNSFLLSKELNYVDAWLERFGINYKRIDSNLKYNQLNITKYELKNPLMDKLINAKQKGKLLLFHPYSANVSKSIPQANAVELLKDLLSQNENYVIVSALSIEGKIKDDRFVDLSKESKLIDDFVYIISYMDAIITTDTSTYHISDAFMIPTVAIFTQETYEVKTKYYKYVKPVYVKDESKSMSKFVFENDDITFYKFDSWKKLKAKKIIKLLDSF